MKYKIRLIVFITILFTTFSTQSIFAEDEELSAEETVSELYKLVSFTKNNLPDWNKLSELFHPDANIALSLSPTEIKTLDTDEFIELWKHDIKKYKLDETGFTENIVCIKTEVFGKMAYSNVIYQVAIPRSKNPPQFGLDSFHLIKTNEQWEILSIVNEVLSPGTKPFSAQKDAFENYIYELKQRSKNK